LREYVSSAEFGECVLMRLRCHLPTNVRTSAIGTTGKDVTASEIRETMKRFLHFTPASCGGGNEILNVEVTVCVFYIGSYLPRIYARIM